MLKDRPLEDAARLQRCIDDLSSLVASPSIAADNASRVGQDLTGKLLSMLEADVLYVRLTDPNGGTASETITLAPSFRIAQAALELGVTLEQAFGPEPKTWPADGQLRIGEATVFIAITQLGAGGDLGTVVAGSQCAGFPAQTDRLLLGAAANQSAIALHSMHRVAAERNAAQHQVDLRLGEVRRVAAERELQRTIDNIPARVGTYNADGSHELINSAVRQISGFATVNNWRDAIHPDDIDQLEQKWGACVASGEPFEMEYRSRADGGFRWYVSRRVPARDELGKIVRWYAVNYDIEDRKRAEEALRRSERKSRLALDSIPGFVAIMTPAGALEAVNKQLVEFCGRTLEELSSWGSDDTIHSEDLPYVIEQFTQHIASGTPYDFEARIRRHDGVYRWLQVRGLPLRDASGTIAQWYVLLTDIDERRRAEAALRQSEARLAAAQRDLQAMIDTIPVFVAAYEPDGTRSFVNRTWQDYMGLTVEAATRRDAGAFPHFHPDDIEKNDTAWRGALASGEPLSIDLRVRRADGQYRWHLSRRVPLRDESGKVVRWYSVGVDIHDQKVAEDARRESEARLATAERQLRLTLDSIPTMTWRAAKNGFVESVNKRWFDYTGCGPEDVPDGKWQSFVHPDDLAELLASGRRNIPAGRPADAEARLRRHDGVYRWFLFRVEPARDEVGDIFAWYGTISDIEDKRRAEAALRKSEADLLEAQNELQLTIDTIPTLITAYQPGGQRIFVNRSWQEYSGISREEAFGPTRWSMTHPDDLERADREWRLSQETETPSKSEVRLRRADGEYRWHEIHRVFRRDESGRIAKWYSAALDIEDRKRAEDARRQSEARLAEAERELRQTLDSIPAIAWRGGPEGYVRHINKRWYEYTGTTPEQSRGKGWRSCVHPDDIAALMATGAQYVPSGQPMDAEARLRRHDGVYRWFLFRPSPARDETGKIVAWYGIITDIEDRKRAEQALQQSEVRLAGAEREARHTLDSIPTIAWRGGANGYVQALNQRWFEYTGTTSEQMRGARWKSCVHPDDIDRLVQLGLEYVTAGVPIECEARLRRHDGEYRWFLFRPAPSRDEVGNIVGWYGSIIDIEDRKQAEQAVAASEHNLQLTIDTIPALAWSSLPDGTAIFTNKHYQDFVGLTLEQLHGLGWTSAVHPDDLPGLIEAWRVIMDGGRGGEVEARLRRHDGVYRRLLFRASPFRDERGKIVRWYGVNTDIEDRKQAEERLRRSEASLIAGQRVSQTGTFSWQLDTNELIFSEELYRIFEFDLMSPVTFERVAASFHPEDAPALAERMKLVRAGRTPPDQDVRLRMPDGRIKHLRTVGRMIDHDDGGQEYLGAIQDVTERRLAEETRDKTRTELAHVTRIMSLGALTASIAHEVNQPLAGIITNASTCLRMLAADPPNVDGARETARRTIRDGNRAADVISRLRALFSRKGISKETVDVNTATREVLSLMFADLLRNRITLRAELDSDRPLLVAGDRVQLQQVILNLVRNAMDAMKDVNDRPRQLLVSARMDEEGRACLIVKDSGVGFDPHGSERLFDAFYTTKGDGMGIGLSVSRSIIESHGGVLRAVSNEDYGATFSFAIPRQDPSDADFGIADAALDVPNEGRA